MKGFLILDINTVYDLFSSQAHLWMNQQLQNNQMLIAGVGTVLLSSILYALKNVPQKVWNMIYNRSTITVNIFSDNANFTAIATELNKNTIDFLSRKNVLDNDSLGVGLGTSWSYFRGKIVKVYREKEKSDAKEMKQDISVVFFFTSKSKVKKLFEEFILEKNSNNSDIIRIYSVRNNWLGHLKNIPKRLRESVFINQETLIHIEKRLEFFLDNKKWYNDRGIPYKYAILLHGVPGTGKTTIAKYIASLANRDVIMVSPSKLPELAYSINSYLTDSTPDGPPEDVNMKFLGIMEDIDTDNITGNREEAVDVTDKTQIKNSFTTLSDLLNSIDGINAPEDFILVATTNYLDKLDPALFRKGRFDDVIEIKPLERSEIIRMVEYFFEETGKETLFKEIIEPITGAEVQDIILTYFDDGIERVIEEINKKGKS